MQGAFDVQVKQLMVGSRVPRPDARDEFDEGQGKGFGSTRMTKAEAEAFLGRYEIVQAKGNDGTGAAGVILLDKVATLVSGLLVVTLAIRSIEFLPLHYKNADGNIQKDESGNPARYGDYERDSSANSQTATHGYAFAQIDRMLAYLDQFAADNPGAKFNLVGGSLSGNIVYSLALLRPDLVSQEAGSNVIFNGTGVGLINGSDVTTAKMQDLMGTYREAYTNPNDIDLSTIADESKRQTLQMLKNMAMQEHQEKLGGLAGC